LKDSNPSSEADHSSGSAKLKVIEAFNSDASWVPVLDHWLSLHTGFQGLVTLDETAIAFALLRCGLDESELDGVRWSSPEERS